MARAVGAIVLGATPLSLVEQRLSSSVSLISKVRGRVVRDEPHSARARLASALDIGASSTKRTRRSIAARRIATRNSPEIARASTMTTAMDQHPAQIAIQGRDRRSATSVKGRTRRYLDVEKMAQSAAAPIHRLLRQGAHASTQPRIGSKPTAFPAPTITASSDMRMTCGNRPRPWPVARACASQDSSRKSRPPNSLMSWTRPAWRRLPEAIRQGGPQRDCGWMANAIKEHHAREPASWSVRAPLRHKALQPAHRYETQTMPRPRDASLATIRRTPQWKFPAVCSSIRIEAFF